MGRQQKLRRLVAEEPEKHMNLAEKMFARGTKSCPIRSDCKRDADRKYFDSLFESDWEVFVVRPGGKDHFEWFTLCCEAGGAEAYGIRDTGTPPSC